MQHTYLLNVVESFGVEFVVVLHPGNISSHMVHIAWQLEQEIYMTLLLMEVISTADDNATYVYNVM